MSKVEPIRQKASTWIKPAHLPYPVLVTAAWALVVVILAAAAGVVMQVIQILSVVLIPLAVALLLSALLRPLVDFLLSHTPIGTLLSVVVSMISLVATVTGAIALFVIQVYGNATSIESRVRMGYQSLIDWLTSGPLDLTGRELGSIATRAGKALSSESSIIAARAVSVGTTTADILAGTLICLFATFFFLYQGRQIWLYLVKLLPRAARSSADEASRRALVSLGAYTRTQLVVALFNGLAIAMGVLVLGAPFVLPLGLVVFVASFVPVLGALVAGILPVLIVLVTGGPGAAAVMLAVVTGVHLTESHVLQPFLMGRAVSLHPLAVLVAVATGTLVAGIPGALFAVPLLAATKSAMRYLVGEDPFPELSRTSEGPKRETDPVTVPADEKN